MRRMEARRVGYKVVTGGCSKLGGHCLRVIVVGAQRTRSAQRRRGRADDDDENDDDERTTTTTKTSWREVERRGLRKEDRGRSGAARAKEAILR